MRLERINWRADGEAARDP